jgi:hypothetical protein
MAEQPCSSEVAAAALGTQLGESILAEAGDAIWTAEARGAENGGRS